MEKKEASIDNLRKKRKIILDEIQKEAKKTSLLEKIAIWITEKVGSIGFFIIVFLWTVVWLSWNVFAPKELKFDPYPAFVLWLFISNMIQLFLMPLIMLGQNVQAKRGDARADADLKINLQAALENEFILEHLENQNEMILKILNSIEKNQ